MPVLCDTTSTADPSDEALVCVPGDSLCVRPGSDDADYQLTGRDIETGISDRAGDDGEEEVVQKATSRTQSHCI